MVLHSLRSLDEGHVIWRAEYFVEVEVEFFVEFFEFDEGTDDSLMAQKFLLKVEDHFQLSSPILDRIWVILAPTDQSRVGEELLAAIGITTALDLAGALAAAHVRAVGAAFAGQALGLHGLLFEAIDVFDDIFVHVVFFLRMSHNNPFRLVAGLLE